LMVVGLRVALRWVVGKEWHGKEKDGVCLSAAWTSIARVGLRR